MQFRCTAGTVFTVSGLSSLLAVPQAAQADWTRVGDMATPRWFHSTTLLSGGKVLVTGGISTIGAAPDSYLASAELFDPATGLWTATGPMLEKRAYHTATLLPNGKVLVVAGGWCKGTIRTSGARAWGT